MSDYLRRFAVVGMVVFLVALAVSWEGLRARADAEPAIQDPTRPVNFVRKSCASRPLNGWESWQLSSTLVSPKRAVAVINGRILQQGDSLDGMKIATVKNGAVELTKGRLTHWLYTSAATIKKRLSAEGKKP